MSDGTGDPARTTPAGGGAPDLLAADAARARADEQRRRRQRGWYFYDWADSAFSTTVVTVFLGPYLATIAKATADSHGYVHPFGLDIRAKAVFPFAVTISVIAQVLAAAR